MPGYLLRCNPHIRGFKEQLDSMGRLRRVHLSTNVRKPSMSGWRSEPEIGGALLVNAIHQLDLATWFVGEQLTPRIALLDNVHHLDAPTEDYFYTSLAASVRMRRERAQLLVAAPAGLPGWSHDHGCGTAAHRGRDRHGLDGADRDRLPGQRQRRRALEGVVGVNQFAKELEHFVDAIENGTPLWVTPEDNYLVQKLIEDCRAAAAAKPLPSAKVA